MSAQPARSSRPSFRHRATLAFAWFAAAMLGLAAGAVWMAVSLYVRAALPWLASAWLALPIGALLALSIRTWVWPCGALAGWMAALATLLAAAYVSLLLAAIRLGATLGLNLIEAMRSAGLRWLTSLARTAMTPSDLFFFALGAALAAWLAGRKPRH